MIADVRRMAWGRVALVAAGYATIDALLIVPLAETFLGLSLPAMTASARLFWSVVRSLFVVCGFAFAAERARASRENLFVAFFVILAGLDLAAHAQGAYFFRPDVDAVTFTGIVVQTCVASAVLAALGAWAFRTSGPPSGPEGPVGVSLSDVGWLWRVPASGVIYFVLFMVAGLMILPFIGDFYAPQIESGRLGLLNFEWEYLNGIWFAVIALPLLRLVPGDWWRAGVTVGVLFCLIRGIAGLIVPNPDMPTPIRMWHLVEVSWSNFVYGLAVGFLFLRRNRSVVPLPRAV